MNVKPVRVISTLFIILKMFILVLGGSGSGKSERAEEAVKSLSKGQPAYYLATMRRDGEEAERRISRHRSLRQGKGFITIELPFRVDRLEKRRELRDATVLLECLSNLVANELFPREGDGLPDPFRQAEGAEAFLYPRLKREMDTMLDLPRNLVVVTNDIFGEGLLSGDEHDDPYIKSYLSILAKLNNYLAAKADQVVEAVVGIPVVRKGAIWHYSGLS